MARLSTGAPCHDLGMPAAVTDTLKVYDILKEAQIPEPQARAITRAIRAAPTYCAGAPAATQAAKTARSSSVMCVALPSGMIRVTTTCW
jgi:hypothetical protein